jgi:hypothetical protein
MNGSVDELELQRCVDGELALSARREFLARVDQAPEGWKTLAMAFIECQDMAAGAREFRDSREPMRPVALAGSGKTALPQRVSFARWASMAAALGLAFWLGGVRPRQEVEAPAVAQRPAASAAGRVTPTFASEAASPEMQLASSDGRIQPAAVLKLPVSSGDDEELAIPLYEGSTLSGADDEIPLWPQFQRPPQVTEEGYRLTSERNVVSIPLEGGNVVYVPVEVSGVRYAVQ